MLSQRNDQQELDWIRAIAGLEQCQRNVVGEELCHEFSASALKLGILSRAMDAANVFWRLRLKTRFTLCTLHFAGRVLRINQLWQP